MGPMELDELLAGRPVERRDCRRDARRRMGSVDGAREHLGGKEIRVGALLREVAASPLLEARELVFGKGRVQQQVGGQIEQRRRLIAERRAVEGRFGRRAPRVTLSVAAIRSSWAEI